MNEKQQTAVQWLENELKNRYAIASTHKFIDLFKQALAMEREQIEQAYKADLYPCSDDDAEQYFTDTYQTEQ